MARTKGARNKSTLARLGIVPTGAVDTRPEDEVIASITERFHMLTAHVRSATQGKTHALVASGAPGIGKSYNIMKELEERARQDPTFRYDVVKGKISAVALYEKAYRYADSGNVLLLDDTDDIFLEPQGMNLLKALLDTPKDRTVSWITSRTISDDEGGDAAVEKGDDLPDSYIYRGSLIFLTNRNFAAYLDSDLATTKLGEHFGAIMSRALYLDMRLHTRREVSMWARHIVKESHLMREIGITAEQEKEIMDWFTEHSAGLRVCSIRQAIQLAAIYQTRPEKWQHDAAVFLLK